VRALGVSTKARLPALSDIVPIAEAGVPEFDVAAWLMLVAPAKTPAPIVERLHTELKRALAAPELKEQIAKLSLLPLETPSIPEMQSFVKSEIVRWGRVVEQAGIAHSE
jgi:tripartite-type tricarboxylate transporter receptor subunit TctC